MGPDLEAILGLKPLYDKNITGRGVTVAVLDTGLYPHKDFFVPGKRICDFRDFVQGRERVYDDNGHGTHVSGIIASGGRLPGGQRIGIAPEATLLPLKVLDAGGSGKLSNMLEAIEWILRFQHQYGIRLVNISVGMPVRNRSNPEKDVLVEKVEQLWDAGMTVVVAAGNEGPSQYTVTSPGVSKKVITVGALDREMMLGKKRSPGTRYSGCGPVPGSCVCKPDVVAPASGILSCDNRSGAYRKRSGTSMATPVVTGTLALLLSAKPWLTNLDIKIRLMETAIDCGAPRNKQGWGILNARGLFGAEESSLL